MPLELNFEQSLDKQFSSFYFVLQRGRKGKAAGQFRLHMLQIKSQFEREGGCGSGMCGLDLCGKQG